MLDKEKLFNVFGDVESEIITISTVDRVIMSVDIINGMVKIVFSDNLEEEKVVLENGYRQGTK